ncbi:MAG: glycosyltransferase family 4 protein [Flavobacteriales bacterium]
MKIAYFIDRLSTPGGMERILILKANYLADKGYEVHIITTENFQNSPYFEINDAVILHCLDVEKNIPGQNFFTMFLGESYSQEYFEKASKLLKTLSVDVCIGLFGNEKKFLHKIKDGSKKVVEFHFSKKGLLETTKIARFPRLTKLYFEKIKFKEYLNILKNYNAFVTLTKQDQEAWGNLKNSLTIPNPIIFEIQEKSADYSNKTILSVGRIHYQKGFDLLIDIWEKIEKRFPDWNLKIVGRREGVKDNLDEIIEKKNLNRIKMISATKDIQKYYYESSLYVSTSRYEGFPLTFLEAQACGLPIVSFDCSTGPSEIIKDNEDGLLATYLDEQDLADKLMILMKDEEKRREFGVKAKENVKRFDLDIIMKKWIDLFNKL